MGDTSKNEPKRSRDIYYYRQRLKNRIFAALALFYANEAKRTGITKKDIAERLNRDPSQITRWLSGPSNLTLDTLSDLLLALDAEPEPPSIVRFADRPKPNYAHPLIAHLFEELGTQSYAHENLPTVESTGKTLTFDQLPTHKMEAESA